MSPAKPLYFSKSSLLSAYQCPKKIFLERHRPELREISARTQASFDVGNAVGAIAQEVYGTAGAVEVGFTRPMSKMVSETARLIDGGFREPIFEATFQHRGVLIRMDVLIPEGDGWRAIEVKASTRVKPEHEIDCAIQLWVMRGVGLTINSLSLAYVDNAFVYRGDSDYSGLLKEEDLTEIVTAMEPGVLELIADATNAVSGKMPDTPVGRRCADPYECSFTNYCWPMDSEFPTSSIGGDKEKIFVWVNQGIEDVRDIPASEITARRQQLFRRVACSGEAEIIPGAYAEIEKQGYPRYYLDFETASPVIPIWAGSRPYQLHAVQWSIHTDDGTGDSSLGSLEHEEFLDLSGVAPMRALAEKMLECLGDAGPVLMWTSYEKTVINSLIKLFPDLEPQLQAIVERLYDLAKVVERHYYHPMMLGSYSIKKVAPAIIPGMDYGMLEGINEGNAASDGFLEAIRPDTTQRRKAELEEQLLRYCRFDTEVMVEIVKYFKDIAP